MEAKKDNGFQRDSTPNDNSREISTVASDRDNQVNIINKKIENIVSAVFLITNLVSNDEIIKTKIRQTALDCLSDSNKMTWLQDVTLVVLQEIAGKVTHMSSLLDIAFWSGLISHMNVSILQKEIEKVKTQLMSVISRYKNKYYINSSFFITEEDLISAHKSNLSKGQKGHHLNSLNKGQDKGHGIKDTSKVNDNVLYNKTLSRKVINEDYKKGRRDAILALLREKSNLTVKDFGSVIKEYSEKTIQRELQALVQEGIIRRQGERRWSTYSLAR